VKLSLYYQIWVDAIVYEKTKHSHLRDWKTFSLIPISVLMGLNLLTVFLFLLAFEIKLDVFIDFNLFPGEMLDGFLSGFITLFLPFLVLNYFLIFQNQKYVHLIEKYPYRKGKLYMGYFLVSILTLIIPLIAGVLLF
jgi:hypothetical protein